MIKLYGLNSDLGIIGMSFIITKETFIFLASLVLNVLTILVVWQKRQKAGMVWLVLAMIAIGVYNFFAMLDASSAELSGRILFSKLEYLGANTVGPFLALFFINFPQQRIKFNPLFLLMVFSIPLITFIGLITNEYHYLFYTGFEHISGTINGYYFLHGPIYWIALSYNYACGIASIILIYINTRRSTAIYRLQSLVLLISSAFPFFSGLMYAFGRNPIPGMDILPVGFSISGLGIVFSVVFLRMFDLVPLSRNLLVENLQDGVVVLDSRKQVVDINPAALQLLDGSEIKLGATIDQCNSCGGVFSRTDQAVEVIGGKSKTNHILSIPTCLTDDSGKTAGYMYVLRNMTEIRRVEEELHQSQERYRSLIEDVVDAASMAICIIDKDFRIIWVNQACVENWFFSRESILNQDIREFFFSNQHPRAENREELIQKILSSYRDGFYLENLEIHFQKAEGKPERWVLYSSKPIRVGYYAGGRIEQMVDITEQKRLQKQVELQAITDELTHIYNRRGLFELGLHDFNRARRIKTNLGVIFLDIDNFKKINDHFGHAKSDQVLVELVNRIKSHLRDMDIFARYGGDEFVILLPEANLQQAAEIARRIKDSVTCAPFSIGLEPYPVTASLGVAQFELQDSFTDLLDRADQCMYRAKQKGRNCIEL
jgi:diguanylate cyclase (GGDEF)-like protein/PAS domain S-box-containing protein